jgi:CelD/BcsL family acetyltransferase involved in cellulose biosynthesis
MTGIVLTAAASFDFASDEYRALFLRSHASAFQHPDWLSPFYRTLARAHAVEPVIVIGRRADTGALVLVVPLVRRWTGDGIAIEYAFLGVTDYALAVIDPALMPAEDRRLARDFLQALGRFDRLEIAPVRQDDLAAWWLLLAARPVALGFGAHHLRVRSSPARGRDLARKGRRLLERGPLQLEIAGPDSVRQMMVNARRFRQGRFRDDPMQSEAAFEFYVEVAARGQRSGLARSYQLRCGDDPVAVLFGLIHGRRFHYLVLGCDYPKFGRFSPGMIMFATAMDDWFAGGGEVFDFTIGDEPFKGALGCERTPMYRFSHVGAKTRLAPELAECADA